MFCKNCGKEMADGTQFCPSCGQATAQSVSTSNGTVKLVVHRKKSFYGCAVGTKIHVDGQLAATIKSDGTATFDLTPGTHEVIFDMWSANEKTNIDLPADCSAVYVEIGLKMGLITNKIKVISIRNEK
ncbi:MAG: zinc-ribbon domain-containing protein [Clostridia bacterium]|nr:zinc-ribbon domain-containing protein [Clostridia bacterium]